MSIIPSSPGVTVRRVIPASAEEIFDAWLDPEALADWMRPQGIERTTARLEAHEGGAFEIVMHHANGPIRHTGVYRQIERPKRLVFTWVSPGTHHTESLVTVELRPLMEPPPGRTGTEVVITHHQLPDEAAVPSHTDGWTRALVRLDQRLTARSSA